MKYEKINKNYTKIIFISLAIIIVIGSALILNITKAKYKTTVSVPIVNGTIKYSGGYDFKVMALYQHIDDKNCTGEECYDPIEEMPGSDYEINTTKSYCTLDGQEEHDKLYTNDNGEHIISKLKKNEKCYLYFDKIKTPLDVLTGLNKTVSESCPTSFKVAETSKNLICKEVDDFGDTYYFRGRINDNWVKFGQTSDNKDIYWRIIRINGNGSIRLIYAGSENPATSDGYIGNSYSYIKPVAWIEGWVEYNRDNMYVGYEWISGNMHGYGNGATKSNVLQELNTWFAENLNEEFNNGYGEIDKDVGFCNNRSGNNNQKYEETYLDVGGTGGTETYYDGYKRLYNRENPTFKCSTLANKTSDYFTYKSASIGTKSLDYPIGLIDANEVVYAGGVGGNTGGNELYYLYTGRSYWTMTPYATFSGDARIFVVDSNGRPSGSVPQISSDIRPVINLKSSVEFIGSGLYTDPYVIKPI